MGSSFSLLNQTSTKTTITAPFDNTAYRFDPRSPTTAFNRTPLKHVASKLKIADLADPRSPAAARTPVRRVLFDNNNDPREPMHNRTPVVAKHGYSLFDPRSPMAGRSPLRPLLSNADPREPMAGRTPLASISATFSDVPTSPSASSRRRQARHTKRALFDADPDDDVLDNQFEQMTLLDNDDDNDWFSCYESDDDDNENNDAQFEDTVSTPDIVQYTPPVHALPLNSKSNLQLHEQNLHRDHLSLVYCPIIRNKDVPELEALAQRTALLIAVV
eukprot:CAMPEP_0168596622 /NCGR_PEP_ID=MMETSP0420-20121227/10115_1 /TAXON_ID=498008 /ORGANISM="Pessonella sp." /LENGTH=273 /DNA_ID=CAMNT_0008633191 /DNA_START=101 /DNA_END=926 /DNA_ORIENTATION=-